MLEWSDTIQSILKKYLRDNVFGPLPAVVINTSDYNSKQLIDVTVTIPRAYQDGEVVSEKGHVIYGVPFVNPGVGQGALTFPVKKGDIVLLIFGMRNTDNWKLSKGVKEIAPSDSRYMSKTDAIAIPGIQTTTTHLNPSTENVELKFKNSSVSIDPDDNITIKNESGTFLMQSSGVVNINGFIINTDGSVSSPVGITAPSAVINGKELDGHTHDQDPDSDGNTQATTGGNN